MNKVTEHSMEKQEHEYSNQKSPDMVDPEHHRVDPHRCTSHLTRIALVGGIIYIFNRGLISPNWNIHFLDSYLGDFLALPVYIPLSITLAERLGLLVSGFELRLSHVLGSALLFSVLFEGIIPLLDVRSISDPLDILAYFGGGLTLFAYAKLCRSPMSLKKKRP